jgi:hypothetical protein
VGETQITSGPSGFTASAPTFTFISSVAGAKFECRFDAEAFRPCTTPYTRYGLAYGRHTFYVRAIPPGGSPDPVGDQRTFTLGEATLTGSCSPLVETDPRASPPYCSIFHGNCPQGSVCTLSVTVSVTDEDQNVSWTVFADLWSGGSRCAPDRASYPLCTTKTTSAYCNSHPNLSVGDRPCPGSASLSGFGDNDFDARCNSGYNQLQPPGPPRLGPDASRQATCRASFRIVPAVPLSALLTGLTASVLVPSAGTLTLSATSKRLLHGARAARKRPNPNPPITPVRIKVSKAGPVAIALKLSKPALNTLLHRHKLVLSLTLAFTAGGGKRTLRTQRVTLALPACPRVPRHSRKSRCAGHR